MDNLTVLYFGFYNKAYSRNRVLINGLRENGIRVIECNERPGSFLGYFKLIWRYLKIGRNYDLMIVAFPGQEVMFLARPLTRKPIVFDAFTSHYGGYILDRKYYPSTSFHAKYYRFLDTYSCRLADMVLLDTQAHIDFFVREFGLPIEKFKCIWVGADDTPHLFSKEKSLPSMFTVLFFGTYIPLQGVPYIIDAAEMLQFKSVRFVFIGDGMGKKEALKKVERLGLSNIDFVPMLSHAELINRIYQADICLGIFGDTPKTQLVIPNKVYEALAAGKPVITSNTPAIRELLTDGENVILCQCGHPAELAEKILELKNSPTLRKRIGGNGRLLFDKYLRKEILAKKLVDTIYEKRLLSK